MDSSSSSHLQRLLSADSRGRVRPLPVGWSTECCASVADACFCAPPGWGSYWRRTFGNAGVLVLADLQKSVRLLWWWRFVALATADADYITAVQEIGSIAQPRRPWVWQVRLGSTRSTLWSVHIGQVGGRRVICSRIHFALVLSRVHNNEEWDWSLNILCLRVVFCVYLTKRQLARKNLTAAQREAVLWRNIGMPFLSGELLERCDEYLKPEIRHQLECIWTGF